MFVFVSLSYHLKLSYAGTNTNLEIALNIQKNTCLVKFSHPKKSRNRKFNPPSPQKILRSVPSPEIWSSPPVCVFRSFLDYIQILDANYCFLLLSVFTVFFAV